MQVIGNIGQDAVVNTVNNKQVANFSVCHTHKWRAQGGDMIEKNVWVNCSLFFENSKLIPYLKKGVQVFLEGEPEANAYTNKQGQVIGSLRLRVTNVQLLGGKQNSTEQNQPQPQVDITEPLEEAPF